MKPETAKPLAGLLLIIAVGAGIAGLILWRDRAPLFQSTAAVRVVRDKTDLEQLGDRAPAGLDQTIFLQNQIETIRSDAVLQKVIDRLALNLEWGKQFANGQPLKSAETMELLRARTQIIPEPGTSLLRIQVSSHDQAEAPKLADAFATAYCEYRMERRRRIAQEAIDGHATAYKENAAKVRQASELVEKTYRELDPSLQDRNLLSQPNRDQSETLRPLHDQLARGTMIYIVQSNQLALSKDFPADELAKLTAQVDRTKSELTAIEAELQKATRQQESLRVYWDAGQEWEKVTKIFAPYKRMMEENQLLLSSLENPPALVEDAAGPAIALPAHKAAAAQACLVGAGVLLVAGVGLFFLPRKSAARGKNPA